jgi:hypothetical protein
MAVVVVGLISVVATGCNGGLSDAEPGGAAVLSDGFEAPVVAPEVDFGSVDWPSELFAVFVFEGAEGEYPSG